jgi:hypothetical protein
MELATRIERATCCLRLSRPLSDNVTPQQTTTEDIADKGLDGAGLSCPGSSVVADQDNPELNPLINSPVEDLSQSTHQDSSSVEDEASS